MAAREAGGLAIADPGGLMVQIAQQVGGLEVGFQQLNARLEELNAGQRQLAGQLEEAISSLSEMNGKMKASGATSGGRSAKSTVKKAGWAAGLVTILAALADAWLKHKGGGTP